MCIRCDGEGGTPILLGQSSSALVKLGMRARALPGGCTQLCDVG